jgi:hypothetical protein
MMTDTGIIAKIEGIEPDAIPQTTATPKSLRISCNTVQGISLAVHLTEAAALELTAALNTHFYGPSHRIT